MKKERILSPAEQAESFIAGLGEIGRKFFREQQSKHNRSLFRQPGGRLSRSAATKAALAQETRMTTFAEQHGWEPPQKGIRPHR